MQFESFEMIDTSSNVKSIIKTSIHYEEDQIMEDPYRSKPKGMDHIPQEIIDKYFGPSDMFKIYAKKSDS